MSHVIVVVILARGHLRAYATSAHISFPPALLRPEISVQEKLAGVRAVGRTPRRIPYLGGSNRLEPPLRTFGKR